MASENLSDKEKDRLIETYKKDADTKRELRQKNLDAETSRPDSSFFRQLDSSVKRNSTFTKKLRGITDLPEDQKRNLVAELSQLNHSKYLSESVQAVADNTNIQLKDIDLIIQLFSVMHQNYSDFAEMITPALVKAYAMTTSSTGAGATDTSDTVEVGRRRVLLRLISEMYIAGIITDASVVYNLLKDMVQKEANKKLLSTLSIILSFVKFVGEVFIGVNPSKQSLHTEYKPFISQDDRIVSEEQQQQFRTLCNDLFDSVYSILVRQDAELRKMEEEQNQIASQGGTLDDATKVSYEKARKAFQKLLNSATQLADALDRDLPHFYDESGITRMTTTASASSQSATQAADGKNAVADEQIWDDEETRSFYENIPDIRELVPASALGLSTGKTASSNQPADATTGSESTVDATTTASAASTPVKAEPAPTGTQSPASAKKKQESAAGKSDSDSSKIDALLAKLPQCCSRVLIDKWAEDFCYVNSKVNRRKLVQALFSVNRTSLELLPHYSRLVAILSPVLKDIGSTLVAKLEAEFDEQFRQKNQINIESKVKNIRFLGELTKFRVCSPSLILNCFARCLDDFTHHNIDIVSHLLETCGRFLYRNKETHTQTENLLAKMMRMREVKSLDQKYDIMVENAYYASKPPDRATNTELRRLPPIQRYIQHLLFNELNRHNGPKILKQLRKLPWNDPDTKAAVIRFIRKVRLAKYNHIPYVASVLSGLARQHDAEAIQIVDKLIEDIRLALNGDVEVPPQRLIMDIKFFGELYNYQMFDSSLVFDMLYMFIMYAPAHDPPHDSLRLRLVCTLLDTCGPYFESSSSRKKLNTYLVYLQRYVISKSMRLSVDMEYMLADTLDGVAPKLKWPKDINEVNEWIVKIESTTPVRIPGSTILWAIRRPPSNQPSIYEEEDDEEEDEEGIRDNEDEDEPLSAGRKKGKPKNEAEVDKEAPGASTTARAAAARAARSNEELVDVVLGSAVSGNDLDRRPKSIEDIEFEREIERLVMDSIQERKSDPQALLSRNISSVSEVIKKSGVAQKKQIAESNTGSQSEATDKDAKTFTFLHRQSTAKGKQITRMKELDIPVIFPQNQHSTTDQQAPKLSMLRRAT